MYNEAIKNRYLDSIEKSANDYKSFFNRSDNFERKLHMDLYDMNEDQLKELFGSLSGSSSTTRKRLAILKSYKNWCREEGIKVADVDIKSIQVDNSKKSVNELVKDPSSLKAYFDKIFDGDDDTMSSNACRAYYWLIYSGLTSDDAMEVSLADINIEERRVYCKRKKNSMLLYDESIRAIRSCMEEVRLLAGFNAKKVRVVKANDDLLLKSKGKPNATTFTQTIRRAEARSGTKISLRPVNVRKCGIFYRTYLQEKEGVPSDIALKLVAETDVMYGDVHRSNESSTTLIGRTARSYLKDYEIWKNAFNL